MHRCKMFNEHSVVDVDSSEWDDKLIYYNEKFDEYGIIIHDGGKSFVKIEFCPWCGEKFPISRIDLWFETLESMGYEEFDQDKIPHEFTNNQWYKDLN